MATDQRMSSPMRSPSSMASPRMTLTPRSACGLGGAWHFEALSQHFHLPLKVAAEKFGVRATAFKKKCRAIGIRHWPYRKVRSLKRSLQELDRCREQGAMNAKQCRQLATYRSQLKTLLSPETYGIDPSNPLPVFHHDYLGADDSSDDDDSSCSSPPRRQSSRPQLSVATAWSSSPGSATMNTHASQAVSAWGDDWCRNDPAAYMGDRPQVSVNFAGEPTGNVSGSDGSEFPTLNTLDDSFAQDLKTGWSLPTFDFVDDAFDSHYSSESGLLPPLPLLSPTFDKRTEADDVFLHISPEYGCLV